MKTNLTRSESVGIVGMGLIGGSLGLDLQKLGHEVFGLVHRSETATRAKERGLAQVVSTDTRILEKCSLIIIALPLKNLIKPDLELINALPKDSVVTDVGSVKTPILNLWKNLHPRFVASHPMAGTNESGVEAGKANLFLGKPWIATPDNETDLEALKRIQDLSHSLGCDWVTASPEIHDEAVALISHLPVLISAALLKTAQEEQNQTLFNLAKSIASSGFSDTTRIGGGNPELGVSMATHNSIAILKALNCYQICLDKFREKISSEEWDELKEELEQTQAIRSSFLNIRM